MTHDATMFTIVLDFRGGTYLHQLRSTSPGNALAEWAHSLDWAAVDGMTEAQHLALAQASRADVPIAVEGLSAVWCASAELDDELALIHIITTEDDRSNSRRPA